MPAGYDSQNYFPEALVVCDADDLVTINIILNNGQNLKRGALLGKFAASATVTAAAKSGNTGNGTIGSADLGVGAIEGTYRAVCEVTASNGGSFLVFDPLGVPVGKAVVGTAFSGPVEFTISDGATDFVFGDTFNITVSNITYNYKLSGRSATDGTQIPDAILAEDCDASGGDTAGIAYITGTFNSEYMTFGSGHTVASTRETLRGKQINLLPAIPATAPAT